MYEEYNPEDLLKVLKECGEFAITKLEEDYLLPGKSGQTVKIKPTGMSFSLLTSFCNATIIQNGGIIKDEIYNESSYKWHLYDDTEILNGIFGGSNTFSIFSAQTLKRTIIQNFIISFPKFVKYQIGRKNIENVNLLLAKAEKNRYKEKKPDFIKNSCNIIKMLQEFSEELYKMEMVFNNTITMKSENNSEIFTDTIGSEIIQYSLVTSFTVSLSIVNKNQALINILVVKYYKNNEIPGNLKEILLKEILEKIEERLFYQELNSGSYKILLQEDASDVFFHEAFAAHLLSGTYITENISTIFRNRKNEKFEKLAGIDLIMDPTINGGFGSYMYDAEGVKSERVTLLKDGKINDLLTDRKSAAMLEIMEKDALIIKELLKVKNLDTLLEKYIDPKFLKRSFEKKEDQLSFLLEKYLLKDVIKDSGINIDLDWRNDHERLIKKSNGHSRVENWLIVEKDSIDVIESEARMSNLIIVNNNPICKKTIEELAIESCKKDGLDFYLSVSASNGEIDVQNGTFIIEPQSIKKVFIDGRKEQNINPGSFSMSLEHFLKSIEHVGHENKESFGYCGASSGYLPVGSYTPKILVDLVPYQSAVKLETVSDEIMEVITRKI